MKTSKSLLVVLMVMVCGIIVVWFSGSIRGGQKTYNLQPDLTIPEYKTDTVHVMEAYERLMDRYMDLTGSHLATVGMDLRNVVARLDALDGRLAELSTRLARIEQTLGVKNVSERAGQGLSSKQPSPSR
ncbi:MAG: hypothetical protein A2Z25_18105 [Planctomycetes bacterium RBG_16_55_9]|nr:MAG: hypothetical protein A2Z25_18105 [Planctomycetes bacterium RBG_16_55_9]